MAMDKARGGVFTTPPSNYPPEAWYTYDDKTCTYVCMAVEYFYWALTSILGAQRNRYDDVSHEWKLVTRDKVEEKDKDAYALFTSGEYGLPTQLPDGNYKASVMQPACEEEKPTAEA